MYIQRGRRLYKRPSKCCYRRDSTRLGAGLPLCFSSAAECSQYPDEREREGVGRRSLRNTGDSQQVLPTNLSVSGRLPRLMGIENFRLRTRDNSSLSRSRSWRPAYALTRYVPTFDSYIRTYDVRTYANDDDDDNDEDKW